MNRRFIRHRIYNIINDDFGLKGRKSLQVCEFVRTKSLYVQVPENRTFSLSQMSRTELARVMPWRENEG